MNKEEWILQVITHFYDKAKTDILIGYHFRVVKDFDTHIPRIAAFWDMQLLGKTNRNFGEPFDVMKVHTPMGIKRGEVGRWLVLLKKTLDENVKTHPEFSELKDLWLKRLDFFEGVFLKFFGL